MANVLVVDNLDVTFALHQSEVKAVSDLDFTLAEGETLAVVGESGSGKSQAFLSIMGLLARNGKASGRAMLGDVNLIGMAPDRLDNYRGKDIAMIFQDPMTSLNPTLRVKTQLAEVLVRHQGYSAEKAHRAVIEMLERVGIPEPVKRANAYPHELSGGMRQRVMIAMALLCKPKVLIADEPTTALDVTVQAQILSLLKTLQKETGMGMVFITHDLAVVSQVADDVLVMRNGDPVEFGTAEEIFSNPRDPYTRALLDALPRIDDPFEELGVARDGGLR
jgi:oligopeptide transport system ATP-binding protein